MNVNATILVQIFNFLLCYVILRLLFLRPAVDQISQEQQEKDHAKEVIAHEYQLVATAKQEQTRQWDGCRTYFLQHRPEQLGLEQHVFQNITPEKAPEPISPQKLDELVKQTSQHLVQRVEKEV